jgi:hypothetical protein
MTTYYLSMNQGTVPTEGNVAEATSAPTADVIVTLGSNPVPAANMSRKFVVAALQAMINYILTDDPDNPNKAGAGTLPLTK